VGASCSRHKVRGELAAVSPLLWAMRTARPKNPKRDNCVMVRLNQATRDPLELAAAENRQPAAKFVANVLIEWLVRRETARPVGRP
jgi:hypothetical protein